MCIIIAKPAEVILEEKIYKDCFMRNPDGAGFSYVEDNKLIIKKGFMKDVDLIDAVREVEQYPLVIHFRAASPGMDVNPKNCHPFKAESCVGSEDGNTVRFKFAIVHNGRLDWRHDKDHSDTSCFVYDCLGPWLESDPWLIERECTLIALRRLVCSHNHTNNKIVIMRHDLVENDTKVVIINEEAGEWAETVDKKHKIWFSNRTYKEPKNGWYKNGSFGTGMYGSENWEDSYQVNHYGKQPPSVEKGQNGRIIETTALFNHKVSKYAAWAKPDKNGWKWSFVNDKWVNEHTKVLAEEIPSRMAPYDVEWYYKHGQLLPPLTKGGADQDKPKTEIVVVPNKDEKVVQIEGGLKITVPRDEDVLMQHLTGDQIGLLTHEAVGLLRRLKTPKQAIAKMSRIEKIACLRGNIRLHANIEVEGFADDEVDLWAVAKIKEGSLTEILELGHYMMTEAQAACNNGNCS